MVELTQDEIVFLERIIDERTEHSMAMTLKIAESNAPKEIMDKQMQGITFMWEISRKLQNLRREQNGKK